jgi:hypothetical protein
VSLILEFFSDGFRYAHAVDMKYCGLQPYSATNRELIRRVDQFGLLPLPMYQFLSKPCRPPLKLRQDCLMAEIRDFRPSPLRRKRRKKPNDDDATPPPPHVPILKSSFKSLLRLPAPPPPPTEAPLPSGVPTDLPPPPPFTTHASSTQSIDSTLSTSPSSHGKKRSRGRAIKGAPAAVAAAHRKPHPSHPHTEEDMRLEEKHLTALHPAESLDLDPTAAFLTTAQPSDQHMTIRSVPPHIHIIF